MDWKGHCFAFNVRVDVEHVESQRYIGDFRLTRVSVLNLLEMVEGMDAHINFCVLGITAELFPNLMADIISAGHSIYGHSMYHEPALGGRPYTEQRHEMRRMMGAIQGACGVRVRALSAPHHGIADENTLRAAAEEGIEFVECKIQAPGSVLPVKHRIQGTDLEILIRGQEMTVTTDYTDRRPNWALKHEEAFNPDSARRKWKAAVDQAKKTGGMYEMIIHPWMLIINAGELWIMKDLLEYARDQGAWFAPIDELIDLAKDR